MLQPFGSPERGAADVEFGSSFFRRISILIGRASSVDSGGRPNFSEGNSTHRAWIVTLALFAVLLSTPLVPYRIARPATTTGLSRLWTRSPRGRWPGPVVAGLRVPTTVRQNPRSRSVRERQSVWPELLQSLDRGYPCSPCLLEELQVGLHEIRAVRPQRGLSVPSDGALVLDQEGED